MKTIHAFIVLFTLLISAEAQSLPSKMKFRWDYTADRGNSTFQSSSLKNWIPFPTATNLWASDKDFVYFPSLKDSTNERYSQRISMSNPYQIQARTNHLTEKPNLYQQQLTLPGKFILRGAVELIPCNDLGYFLPEPIARNYE
ncbi:hypothetical protein RYH73_18775 [Olivibacter sp. CPCC 100613]|uniref:hypothetical protein n=1 Tax=Olivibacter sp. CPCC 100613 TaxID=3079931 RepID=UPI002FF51032